MRRLLTPEMQKFIVENVKGRTVIELTSLVNAKFGTTFTNEQIKQYKSRYKLRSETPGGHVKGSPSKVFPAEVKLYIKNNCTGIRHKDMAEQLNAIFGTSYTAKQIASYYKNHGIKSGLTGHFPIGNVPHNKGMKGIRLSPETEFKKGNTPYNTLPVGTKLVKADGYVWVKIAEPDRWKQAHRLIWEEAYGEIPAGHVVIFADGDRMNTAIENLRLVSRKKLAVLNKKGLLSPDPDATDVGLTLADIYIKIAEIERERT